MSHGSLHGRGLQTPRPSSFVGDPASYCCLSYCWGGDQSVRTTWDTLADYVKSIPVDRLPRTIRDAIRATVKLGLRYIWIDALCIIQDNPIDKMREIANMPYIFKGARVTLLAASAATSTAGFLQPRNNLGRVEDTCFKLPFLDAGGAKGSVILAQKPLFETKSEPVDNRAWILQEQLLSPRLLIFGSERIWWSCFTSSTPAMTQNALETNVILRDARWEAIVEEYTQRKRTIPNDMLPAISGIAEDYQHNAEIIYLAGLWKHSFPHNLLWFNLKSQERANNRTISLCKRPSKYRAPTWSWASIDDPDFNLRGNLTKVLQRTYIFLVIKTSTVFPFYVYKS
ncbi:heterokaryon incompatibility protein-domain-containing protein [Hyaloscypha finlandica]|nr:heterokaryon incompatibility protein-domain-containing protein [Hyaloscypha finlandica]